MLIYINYTYFTNPSPTCFILYCSILPRNRYLSTQFIGINDGHDIAFYPFFLSRREIGSALGRHQCSDGSFRSTLQLGERDLRFTYSACGTAAMLGEWGAINVDRAAAFVMSCMSYEGAFGQVRGVKAASPLFGWQCSLRNWISCQISTITTPLFYLFLALTNMRT